MEALLFLFFKIFLLLSLLFCVQPLKAAHAAGNRSPRQQASAVRAREAEAYVSSLSSGKAPHSDHGPSAFKDCKGMMAHSADRLQRSAEEMNRLGRAGSSAYWLRLSNVQTWVSSALTDQDMCLDSLRRARRGSGGRLEEAVRRKVAGVRMTTSNALSLVNRMN